MAVIKGKEKFVKKKLPMSAKNISSKAKKILSRPQDNQPIPTVGEG